MELENNKNQFVDIRHGDCKEVLKSLADNSVDAIVTDPPYELTSKGINEHLRDAFDVGFNVMLPDFQYKGMEDTMNQLPADVSIKFMRPVAFYPNLFRFMQSIRTEEAIIQSYGGNTKEPWVSPLDISNVIVEELDKPFEGKSFRYIASDEISPSEVATILGEAIGNRKLKWQTVSAEQLLNGMQVSGMNEWVAKGFIEMQAAQGTGILYEDFYKNKPELGKVKMMVEQTAVNRWVVGSSPTRGALAPWSSG